MKGEAMKAKRDTWWGGIVTVIGMGIFVAASWLLCDALAHGLIDDLWSRL